MAAGRGLHRESPQVLWSRERDPELFSQRAAELVLGERFDLEEAGSQPTAEHFLAAQGAQDLFPRNITALLEKLTQAN